MIGQLTLDLWSFEATHQRGHIRLPWNATDGYALERHRAGLAAVLAIERAQSAAGLDLIDVVPSYTEGCLSLQCTGCGWTRHIAPGHAGGRALAHIVDLAQAHAREVDHGESEAP